jgi:hypothetical protein
MWQGGTMQKILYDYDQGTFVLAIYLMTSEFGHMSGLFRLPMGEASEQTNLSTVELKAAMNNLVAVGFCKYDQTTGIVWVLNMLRYQIGSQLSQKDHRYKAVARHVYGTFLQAPSKPLQSPIEAPVSLSVSLPPPFEGLEAGAKKLAEGEK